MFNWTFLLRLWKCAQRCLLLAASGVCLLAQNSSASPAADPSGFLYEKPAALSASIYARDSNPPQLLFRFRRTATRSGSIIDVVRDYTYPDGKPAAREHVVYHGNALTLYELNQLQTGGSGSARIVPDPKTPGKSLIAFEYDKKSESRTAARVTTETLAADTLANDMMGAFLSSHYDQLDHGAKVTCHCLVITRKQTVGFSLVKQSDTSWRGQPAIIVKMQPTSLLVSALVDPLYFTIAKAAPHYVFQYVGRTTPKIREHGHWKDLDAVTVFDW